MKARYLASDAEFSDDRRYRYMLARRVAMGERSIAFVGLNPSTADLEHDDPTVRKCAKWAAAWGFDWFYMLNLNGFRSTNPKALPLDDITAVGPGNQDAIRIWTQRSEVVVACWGQNKLNRYATQLGDRVLRLPQTQCLGQNANGTPKHPLYLAGKTELRPYVPRNP